MAVSNDDDLLNDLPDELGEISRSSSFEDFLTESNLHPPDTVPDNNNGSLPGITPELNVTEDQSAVIQQAASFPSDIPTNPPRCLQIIAQPNCSANVRYRKDYLSGAKRRVALRNKNPDSSYTGPAVSILLPDLNPIQYFIGVSLTLPKHEDTQCYYVHPYELESIDHADYNDRSNNTVWYPIRNEDLTGLKSFPDLHVVRKTEQELKDYGNLRPFLFYDVNLLSNHAQSAISTRKMVAEYNLKKAHLAFFIGQKINATDDFPTVIESLPTEFSDVMTLVSDATTVEDSELINASAQSNLSPPPTCDIDQYAPRYGYTDDVDPMLIFFKQKLDQRKYGKIQITFQSTTSNPEWSVKIAAANITVEGQVVWFPIPKFTQPINTSTPVNVILEQRDRPLGTLVYSYIPKCQCAIGQNATNNPVQYTRSNSNKRPRRFVAQMYHEESDAVVPLSPDTPEFQSTTSVPESISSNTTPEPSSTNTKQTDDHISQLMEKLYESIESLFKNNDYKPFLRVCRRSVQNNPELLYTAIDNNYSDIVSKFIPVAGKELMQKKNQHGETVLLQSARLNRIQMVKAALERKEANELLEDTDSKERNIFHILALNRNSDQLLDLIIDHLLKQKIDISKKFDEMDEDNHTPLELAILNNNLPVTRRLLKYFNTNISHDNGENLIHLAVRYGDLDMLKYLLNEEQLIEQGNRISLIMTPMELAQSLNHTDMMNYLKDLYPQPDITKDKNSNND